MAVKPRNPIIKKLSSNGDKAEITFVDGRDYELQHPGIRVNMEWQKENFNITEGFDNAAMLDNFFEHCVYPIGHGNKPDLDSITPAEATAWSKVMHKFLSGDLQTIVDMAASSGKKNQKPDSESQTKGA
jgi:hypothetical protein